MTELSSDQSETNNADLSIEQRNYLHSLQKTIDYLDDKLPNSYWVIGGIAKNAYVNNKNFSTLDKNGKARDLDILVKKKDLDNFEEYKKHCPTNIPLGCFLNRYVHLENSSAYLKLGSKIEEVPKSLFEEKRKNFFGVEFPTLPPETLFHLYCIRGKMRPKDFMSALTIGRHIKDNPSHNISEDMYHGFHHFSKHARDENTNPQVLIEQLAEWYNNTQFGQKIPLNSKIIRPIALHIWKASGMR